MARVHARKAPGPRNPGAGEPRGQAERAEQGAVAGVRGEWATAEVASSGLTQISLNDTGSARLRPARLRAGGVSHYHWRKRKGIL